ncbi:MAG: hypothetical protein OXN97_16070 [Bryobacterales bacterium]|nr:hypothetical protein [Bryobacterales bacterium]
MPLRAILWWMRVLACIAILALGGTGCLALPLKSEVAEPPFAELWHVNGVTTSAGGYGIALAWISDSYSLQLPGRRATTWSLGDDPRQGAGIVVSCRVPATPGGEHEGLKAVLLLNGHWPRRGKQAVPVPVRARVGGWEFGVVLEPVRDPPDRVEYASAMTKWLDGLGKGPAPDPAGPVTGSGVEHHLGPVAVLDTIAADTEAVVTLEGEKTRVELRFEPDPEKARIAQLMAQRCKGR